MTKYPILVKVVPEHCSVSTIHPISLKFIRSGVTVLNQAIFMSLSPNSLSPPMLQCIYCLPSFFSVNGFYGFYGGILHGRAPIVSTPGQIPAMSSHPLKFSPSSDFFGKVLPARRFLGIFSFCDAFVRRLFTLGIAWEPKHFALGTCGAGAVPGKGERSAGKGRMKASSCGRVSP